MQQMNKRNNTEGDYFDAEKFVDCLLDEGSKIPCDETVKSFHNKNEVLPPFYEERTYKRGQQFFNDHIFALFYGKILGLLSVLAIPSILKILVHTRMSGTPMTAYKRYLATVFHMVIWYKSSLTPGSSLWASINDVKSKHNSSSKKCAAAGIHRINQKDMALTQFGFMGYAIVKKEQIGLHNITDKEWRAFVHIWRVVGYIMGIEDRFNICRDSVEETTEICKILMEKVFRPHIEQKDPIFLEMAFYLVDGMWAMNPTLQINIYLTKLYRLLQPSTNAVANNNNLIEENNKSKDFVELTRINRLFILVDQFVVWSLQFRIFRWYHNYVQHMTLWLMRVCPFLAYYKYGYANSHVVVIPEHKKNKTK